MPNVCELNRLKVCLIQALISCYDNACNDVTRNVNNDHNLSLKRP